MTGSCVNVSDGWPLRAFSRSRLTSMAASEPCGMPEAYTQSIWSRISKPASSIAQASRWYVRLAANTSA